MGTETDPKVGQGGEGDGGGEGDVLDPKIVKLVNSAVTSQLKRHGKAMEGSFATMLETQLASFGLKKVDADQDAPDTKKEGQGKPAETRRDESSDEVRKLRREMTKYQKQLEATEARERQASLKSALAGKVKTEAMGAAAKLLSDRVVMADGEAMFKTDDGDVSLEEGIAAWVKSPEGAIFAPAPSATMQGRSPKLASRGLPRGGGGGNSNGADTRSPAQKTADTFARFGLKL